MKHRACLAGVTVGDGVEVAVMGALNVSPESFYGGSVMTGADELVRAADAMARAGAALIDVGAMSTAPYLSTRISECEEAERLAWGVSLLVDKVDVPVSADTSRARPARAALDAGARVINDVTGLSGDSDLARVVAAAGAGLIAMASERPVMGPQGVRAPWPDAIDVIREMLEESLGRTRDAGIPRDAVVIDPGIGFFRNGPIPWHEWDCSVLARLSRLRALGRPICVGVSRKSFIGALSGAGDPGCRLPGSLAAATAAVLAGAHMIRTHDVGETLQAVRVTEAVRRSARSEAE